MKPIDQLKKDVPLSKAVTQFIFPFSLNTGKSEQAARLEKELKNSGFEFFSVKNDQQEHSFYGDNASVIHSHMEQYFLPYIEKILFPESYGNQALSRFSKPVKIPVRLNARDGRMTYEAVIHSIDFFVCPFQIGMIVLRTELVKDSLCLSEALDFQFHFRVLEQKLALEREMSLIYNEQTFQHMQDFIFEILCPVIRPYVSSEHKETSYIGSLPYFVDERMYTSSMLTTKNPEEEIHDGILFRIGQVNGYSDDGNVHLASSNPEYISEYVKQHTYNRWAPNTHYVISDHTFTCITTESSRETSLYSEMYGQHFYNLILHFFYKIVLLKLSFIYSRLYLEKKRQKIEGLIRSITEFTGQYYFHEISSRTEGRELSRLFSRVFQIVPLYDEVTKTLDSLFQNEEKLSRKRNNYLLLILTVYTVISGIYGMNLVIDDWKGKIDWSKLAHYSFFEYISFTVAVTGIAIGIGLAVLAIVNLILDYKNRAKNLG